VLCHWWWWWCWWYQGDIYSAVVCGKATYESSLRSFKWNRVSARWPPTDSLSCKLDFWVCLYVAIGRIFTDRCLICLQEASMTVTRMWIWTREMIFWRWRLEMQMTSVWRKIYATKSTEFTCQFVFFPLQNSIFFTFHAYFIPESVVFKFNFWICYQPFK